MSTLANGTAANATTHGNFDLVKKFKLDFADIHVSKWKSRSSGLSVVHLDYDAPLVNGYFVVATEIFDDSGCPHTLEHLVFMGSEKYPYKGIIDHLANRGFSNGTNAWTDTDHTAYTVSTAGEQGFLQLLPIYVDHILYPTLTKAGFTTEVHHIDGQGEDSGVVYSEMQGRENTSGDLMALRAQQLAYPPGSAYRSETGGLMEALRVLTIEQIRKYHHTYYVPHNLTLIVSGKLASGTTSLLDVVQQQVEPSIVAHGQNQGVKPPGWKRPFLETPSAQRTQITETIRETVDFPEKDESVGELLLSFQGPPPTAFLERKALDILGTYLTSSPVAPLNKEFVESENPLCTYIYFGEDTRATYVELPVYVGSIPTEHLDAFDEKLKESLRRIADEGLDMSRMGMVISRDERQLRSKVESSQGDTFSGNVITDALYGSVDGADLAPSMDEINYYTALKNWTNQQWVELLRKYYIDPPSVVVRGRPSGEMADRLEKVEKERVTKQKATLGPTGLAECERVLEEAKKEHEKEIPKDVLTSFPVPSVKSISWIPVQSFQEPEPTKGKQRSPMPKGNEELAKHIESDGTPLPFFVQYDHVKSDFVTVHAYFSLAKLPERLRPYMSTYLSAFFSLPVKRSTGEKLNHEEVVHRLDSDTVSYEVALGVNNVLTETMRVSIKVETAQYENAIAWLKDLVYGSQFDKERLAINVAKVQQSLPEMKRDGDTVLGSVSAELLYDKSSTSLMNSIIPQMDFIPKVAQQLQDSPEDVLKDFEEIRSYLTDPTGVRISVNGNVLSLKEPRSAWARHFGQALPPSELAPYRLAVDTLGPVGKNPVKKAVVVSLPTIESAFAMHTAKGVQGWGHPEYPAMRVAVEVLNATESYLWRYIRGSGLAYGANCGLDLEAGLVNFSLYRSSNSMEAFKQAAGVIKGLTDGSIALDDTVLDAAKSSIVYGVAKSVSTSGRAALTSFVNQGLKGVSQNFNIELLEKFQDITKEDVLAVLRRYFLPLFDASSSVAVVVTAPSKAEQVTQDLGKAGFDVAQKTLQVEADEDEDSEGSSCDSDSESGSDR
ncbi:Metalloenzyme, LuxS/M16 peptidase-like protein [Lenzites betulinus]|nr:Metalloenzyme, LuxS/M16 peptidase-like protein [Lenzites betulinus]